MKVFKIICNAGFYGVLMFNLIGMGKKVQAQTSTVTTTTSYTANNGNGLTTFNFENTNPYPIIIDSVYAESTYSGDCTFFLWYNLTPVNGTPGGAIPTTTGWIAADTEVVNIASTSTQQAVLVDVGLVIPPNTTVGMCVGGFHGASSSPPGSGAMRYYTLSSGAGNTTFSGGGCNIITGDNVSYGGTSYTTTSYNYPRGFVGSIVFEKQGVPDNAGIDSIVNPNSPFCSGMQELKVRLRNFGLNTLNSVDIYWEIDGQQFGPLAYNMPVDSMSSPDNWAIVSLGMVNFPYDTARQLKVWTSLPNGVADNQLENDTISAVITADMQNVTANISPGDTAICVGTSVVLDAGQQPAGCIFVWSNGAVTQSTSVSQGGDYSVIVQSPQGCFAYDTVSISENPVLRSGVFGAVDNGGRNFTFTAVGDQNVTNYSWNFGDGQTMSSSSNVQPHHYAQDGTYAVTLKEGNACDTVVLSKQVYVSITPSGIHSVSGGWDADLKVYPNPANTSVTMSTEDLSMNKIVVYNVLGQKVYEAAVADRPHQYELNLKDMASGVYHISVYTDKGMFSRRLNVVK